MKKKNVFNVLLCCSLLGGLGVATLPAFFNSPVAVGAEAVEESEGKDMTGITDWKASDDNFVSIKEWAYSAKGFGFDFKPKDGSLPPEGFHVIFYSDSTQVGQGYLLDKTICPLGKFKELGDGWYRIEILLKNVSATAGTEKLTLNRMVFDWGAPNYFCDMYVKNMSVIKNYTDATKYINTSGKDWSAWTNPVTFLNISGWPTKSGGMYFEYKPKVASNRISFYLRTNAASSAETNWGMLTYKNKAFINQNGTDTSVGAPTFGKEFITSDGYRRYEFTFADLQNAGSDVYFENDTLKKANIIGIQWCNGATSDYSAICMGDFGYFNSYSFKTTFNVNGTLTSQFDNEHIALPEDPTAPTGKHFVGWFEDDSFTTPFDSSIVRTADTTLYAGFAEHDYSISYGWDADVHDKCVAVAECACGDKVTETVTDCPAVTHSDATCLTNRFDKYEAEFTNTLFKTQYSEPFEVPNTKLDHNPTQVPGKAETCTADGFKEAYHCTGCDLYYEDLACEKLIGDGDAYADWLDTNPGGLIPAHAHTTVSVPGQDETCTADGWAECYKCSECLGYFEDSDGKIAIPNYESWKENEGKIPAHDHPTVLVPGQAETCTADGWAECYKCSECLGYFEDQEATTPIADYDSWKLGDGKVLAHPHTVSKVDGQAPTCTLPGWKDYYQCSECKAFFEDDQAASKIADLAAWKTGAGKIAIDPDAHDELVLVSGQKETCTADGWNDYYKCEDCGKLYEDILGLSEITNLEAWKVGDGKISAHAHTTVSVPGQAETCTADGYKACYQCSECNGYFEDAAAKVAISNYEAWKTGAGKIPAHAHTVSKVDGQAPTCTLPGWKDYYQCSECKAFFEDDQAASKIADLAAWKTGAGKIAIDPDAHDELSLVEGKAPTCKEAGWKDYYKCEDCGKLYEDILGLSEITNLEAWKVEDGKIDVVDHDLVLVEGKAPTCTLPGWKDYYKCSFCDKLYEDMLGLSEIQDLEAWKVGDGKIDPLGHRIAKVNGQAATCEADGFKDYYKCDVCNEFFEDLAGTSKIADLAAWKAGAGKINKTGHTYTFVDEVKATKDADGVKAHYECTGCDELFIKDAAGNYVKTTAADLVIKYQSGGCGGSIVAGSAVVCGLALAGLGLVIAKRKKED